MAGSPLILTVTQLNTYVKSLLDGDKILTNVYVAGEISNFSDHYRSGHLYMSLKDAGAAIKAVMFSHEARRLRFQPESGMRVLCRGRVSVYERDGQYQLYIDEMQPDGVGALNLAFEQTKQRLEAQGLFDEAHKKPLPRYPKRIAVITSPTGAARRDIEQVIARRYPLAEILLYPVLVQGDDAPGQLAEAVRQANERREADLIIIGRGGGSFEELFAFNDEGLAHEIHRSEIPIISAVGHETDYTICDFVADVRAATPSVAAELATPDGAALRAAISHYKTKIAKELFRRIGEGETRLNTLREKEWMKSPAFMMEQRQILIDSQTESMEKSMARLLEKEGSRFAAAAAGLQMLSPLQVLSRGYAIAFQGQAVVRSVKDIKPDAGLRIRLPDGECITKIEEIRPERDVENES